MRYKIVRTIKRSKCPVWTYYLLYCIGPTVYETVSSARAAKKNLDFVENVVRELKVATKKSSLGKAGVLQLAKLVKNETSIELRSLSNTLYLKFKIYQYE